MDDVEVICPYCHQLVLLVLDPEARGSFIQDCDLCCRPWQVQAKRDENGEWLINVERT
tara:strand:- start:678 stop:851 length:174 start_codon:yes stop_codon:yes gene_type:complete